MASTARRKPRITHRALDLLNKKLTGQGYNWKMFASVLDQRNFTDEYIQCAESRCQREGFSPLAEVLRIWQQRFGIQEDIPVQRLIDVLQSIERKDVASLIDEMMKEGTFLDFNNEPCPSPTQADSMPIHQTSSDPVTSTSQLLQYGQGDTSPIHLKVDNPIGKTQHCQSPQESSCHNWTAPGATGITLLTPNFHHPAFNIPTPHQQTGHGSSFNYQYTPPLHHLSQARNPTGSQTREIPQNLTRSNRSLVTDGSLTMRSDPNPNLHRQRGANHTSAYLTWPHSAGRSSRQSISHNQGFTPNTTRESQTMLEGPGFSANSIPPLRSVSPQNTTATGASPVPVQGSNQNMKSFITYAYSSYRRALELGCALKHQGLDVTVDRKTDHFASDRECQETTLRLFNEATHIVIIYDVNYIDEIKGRVETPLNTRLIYNLMHEEFRRRQNVRFVPIIDYERITPDRILPVFSQCSNHYTQFVFRALRSYRTARQPQVRTNEVSIERTVYTSR